MLTLPLDSEDASHSELAGSKAARLSEQLRAGMRVPGGFVVTVVAFERFAAGLPTSAEVTEDAVKRTPVPEDVANAIREALAAAALSSDPVAARSSGVAEDLPDASFAGQYETVLNLIGADAVIEGVRACWASAFADRVLAYRRSRKLEGPPRMAVLVQRMVAAECAGVAFSANPLTGNRDEVVVNAVAGLGESLVSGQATADEWIVRKDEVPRAVRETVRAASSQVVASVADLARRVDHHYGVPQDIEWAVDGTGLYLLQARPITALPEYVEWKAPEPGYWIRTFRLGEWLGNPITPLFETWLLWRLEERLFGAFARIMPAPTPRPYHVTVRGWYFTTANFVPRSVPHGLWLLFRYILPAALRRPRQVSIMLVPWAHVGMKHFEAEWRAGPARRYEEAVERARGQVESASAGELTRLIDHLANLAGDEVFYFFAVGGSAWKAESQLAKFYSRHLAPRIGGNHQVLLQGLDVSRDSRDHVVLSLDWYHPTLGELAIRHDTKADSARRSEATQRREKAMQDAEAALRDAPGLLARFRLLAERAQHYGAVREEQAAHLTLAWPLLRAAVRRLGEHLAKCGTLAAPDDTYFLSRDEVLQAIASSSAPQLASAVGDRRSTWERQGRLSPPPALGTPNGIQRRIFGREAQSSPTSASERTVVGVPASPGRAVGPARVIRGPEGFDGLKAGEVLVAPATTPAWTPLFARAAAVVTDTGSLMAHASLVAREYGIPAVVGTGNATQRIRDGQTVAVDGSRGLVELLS